MMFRRRDFPIKNQERCLLESDVAANRSEISNLSSNHVLYAHFK